MPGLKANFKEQLLKDKVIKSTISANKLFLEILMDELVAQCEKRTEPETAPDEDTDEVTLYKYDHNFQQSIRQSRFMSECHFCRKRIADLKKFKKTLK